MRPFQKLDVWEKAHDATLAIYRASQAFPTEERFGLTSQIRRSAASIGANLAEGSGRGRDTEFAQFVRIAMGSASETEYHLLLARDLGYLPPEQHGELEAAILEVERMLASFHRRLLASSS